MFKARALGEGGQSLIVLGLSNSNCGELLADRPILFDGAVVEFAGLWFCITYRHADGKVKLARYDGDEPMLTISLSQDELTDQRPRMLRAFELETGAMRLPLLVVVFRDVDEQTMAKRAMRFVGPTTRVTGDLPKGTFPIDQN